MSDPRWLNRSVTSEQPASEREPMFCNPTENSRDHHDHIALIYESQDEQFAGVIPFIREGLERGEQCLYATAENTKSEVLGALRDAGIDVETACKSGQLSVESVDEIVPESEEFDPERRAEFLANYVRNATDEGEYEGVRITGENTWALDDDVETDLLIAYERILDEVLSNEACSCLCQYNRTRFSSGALEAIIQSHPRLIYDGTLTENFYYVPPEESADPDSERTVERQIETLVERTRAKNALEAREQRITTQNNRIEQLTEGVLEASPTGIAVFDTDGKTTLVNDRTEEILGVTSEEIVGRPYDSSTFDLINENGEPMAKAEIPVERVKRTGKAVFGIEVGFRRPDGERIWLSVNAAPLFSGEETSEIVVSIEDITERKRREQLLVEQKDLLERIASGAPVDECLSALCAAVSRLDSGVQASILLADEERMSFERSIAPELSPSWEEELEGVPIGDPMIGTCSEAVFRGESISCEDIANDERWSKDWREACVENGVLAGHSEPIRNVDGTAEGSFMLCFDEPREPNEWERRLTDFATHVAGIALERERSRRALRESEERQRLALEAGETGVWELDLRGEDSPVRSPRHDEIFGYEARDEWSLDTFLDHVHPEDRKRVEQRFEAAFQTGTWEFECRISRADDEQRWITARGEFYYEEREAVRAVGTVKDITEGKQREHRLARQREQIETLQNRLLETSPTGILVVDAAGEITLSNERAKEILGRTGEELAGLSHDASAFGMVNSDGKTILKGRTPFERVRRTGEAVFDVEVGTEGPDGERIWLSMNAAPVYNGADEISEMVVTLDDITERKQAEDALERRDPRATGWRCGDGCRTHYRDRTRSTRCRTDGTVAVQPRQRRVRATQQQHQRPDRGSGHSVSGGV